MTVNGKALPNGVPAAAMAAGIAFVPEDRRQQGLVMDLGIDHNVALASLQPAEQGRVDPPVQRARSWP